MKPSGFGVMIIRKGSMHGNETSRKKKMLLQQQQQQQQQRLPDSR